MYDFVGLSVSLYMYTCMYISVCLFLCLSVSVCFCVSVSLYLCLCTHLSSTQPTLWSHPSAPTVGLPWAPSPTHPIPPCTFALPVCVGRKADMAPVLSVELGHERLVGVPDEQDGRVEGLNLLLATLVRLDADGPPAAPVVTLPLEPFPGREERAQPVSHGRWTRGDSPPFWEAPGPACLPASLPSLCCWQNHGRCWDCRPAEWVSGCMWALAGVAGKFSWWQLHHPGTLSLWTKLARPAS